MVNLAFSDITQRFLKATALGLISGLISVLPARAAEQIYLDYGLLSRTIPTSSLEAFAENGSIDRKLAPYLNRFSPEQQARFQQVLRVPLSELATEIPEQISDPFSLSQALYSPIGEFLLARLGQMVRTEANLNGDKAIRAALVLAAAESNGGSLIQMIRNYPSKGLRLDLPEVLSFYKAIETNRVNTQRLGSIIAQRSSAAAELEPTLDYAALPLLADTGRFSVEQRSLILTDDQRDRRFSTDLYLPQNLGVTQDAARVIILSHGYGDTRIEPSIVVAARKLASNGFVVAVPEHVGSNQDYQYSLGEGLRQDFFDAMEFVDRPLDVSFLLDTLEQLNVTEFRGQLQLDQVAIMGHSFGGYTALAAAGSTVDVSYLKEQCDLDEGISADQLNVALLLQCRVLELESSPEVIQKLTDGSLTDKRIGLVFTLAPVSSLFGANGVNQIKSPTVILGGENDWATPVALEQLTAFQGLKTSEKYLYLGDNLSHNPALTRSFLNAINPNSDISENFEQTQELFSSLLVTLAIAQAQVHLNNDESYRPYLTSSYVEAVSEDPVRLHLVRTFPDGF